MFPPRERVVVRRFAVLRVVLEVPVARFAAEAVPAFFAAAVLVDPLVELFARVEVLRVDEALRVPVELLLRAAPPVARRADPRDEPELALASPSIDHLPDITR